MKEQISLTIDKNILNKIDKKLKNGFFRNKSHFFEYAVRKMLEEKNE